MGINNEQTKLDEYGLPVEECLIPTVMFRLWQHSEVKLTREKLAAVVADDLELPDKLRNLTYERDPHNNIIEDHIIILLAKLRALGMLRISDAGVYSATFMGETLYRRNKKRLTFDIIKAGTLSQEFAKQSIEVEASARESEMKSAKIENAEVESNLLVAIRRASPIIFENLVTLLLKQMGYQGNNHQVIMPSKNGSLKGVISNDTLGKDVVYLEVQRYLNIDTVPEVAINDFLHDFSQTNANRAVFMTTRSFASQEIEKIKTLPVTLIDGVQLAALMLTNRVGVTVEKEERVSGIDEDCFKI